MKAGILYAKNDIRYEEVEMPKNNEKEVLVKVKYTGVCGSDLPRVFGDASRRYPNILGHEFSGTVVAVGQKVVSVSIGDKVAGIPLIPCMNCEDCREGNYSLCKHYGFVGSRQNGSMAEYVVVPEENVFVVDNNVSYLEAAFFEPATVALHGIRLLGSLKEGFKAVILGGGTIGILVAQILKALGSGEIAIVGRRKERLEITKKAGFTNTYSSLDEDYIEKLLQFSYNNGFDYVIETSGSIETIKLAFQLVKNKGKICYIGTPKSDLTFTVREWEFLNRKEASIVGSWMSYSAPFPGEEWKSVSALFQNGKIKIYPEMIHNIFPLKEVQEAFACFNEKQGVMGKVLIDSEM